jgi:hypothetical protein
MGHHQHPVGGAYQQELCDVWSPFRTKIRRQQPSAIEGPARGWTALVNPAAVAVIVVGTLNAGRLGEFLDAYQLAAQSAAIALARCWSGLRHLRSV